MELPIAFENRMKQILGDEYGVFLEALLSERAVKGLRVNTAKLTVQNFQESTPFPLTAIPYADGGFIVSEEAGAGKHPYHHAGVYYMQDPGAMATVAALPQEILRRSGLRVLDLCAAPGGKTTQIASAIAEKNGVVLSNEYSAARSRILAGNVERMGLTNVCVTNLDTRVLAETYPGSFDLVVCDAPCSGEGMFRKNDRAIEEWSEENVASCALRQAEILGNGAKCVAPGGYLLYSTCTYAPEENEEIVAAFLSRHPSFSLCPCDGAVVRCTSDGLTDVFVKGSEQGADLSLCRRFYPHVSEGEGQFVALLRRSDEDRSPAVRPIKNDGFARPSKPDLAAVQQFLSETVGQSLPAIGFRGGNALTFPVWETNPLPCIPIGTVALGVAIGEVRKGRIVPHHHFFTAFGTKMKSRVVFDPSDEAVHRYLAGEEISVPTTLSGYTAVLLRIGDAEVTLGGGKASGGRLKNYYPKGLRVR